MKILYVILDGKISGGNNVCAALIQPALNAGHEVELLTPSLGPLTDSITKKGIKIHLLNLARSFEFHKSILLASFLKKRQIDLVHTHTHLSGEILCRIACFLAKVPIICHQHQPADVYNSNFFIRAYQKWLDRITSKWVNRFIAVSGNRKKAMIDLRGYQPHQIRLVYNGIDVNRFSSADRRESIRKTWNLEPEQTAIGLIARLEISKGQDTLIEAAPLVLRRYPETRFFMIGGDHIPHQPNLKRYQKTIQHFGMSDKCFLLGFEREIQDLMSALDMIVLPSWWEGHPLVVLEAMAAQKPVIASRVGGTPEIVEHETNGLLIPPRDPEALAEAICRLIENPALARQMASRAYVKAAEQFDQTYMADQILALYNQIFYHTTKETHHVTANSAS